MKYFDLHCDTPYEMWEQKYLCDDKRLAVSPYHDPCFQKWIQCCAVWIRDDLENPFEQYREILSNFLCQRAACKEKSYQVILSVEGGALIEDLFEDGIRILSLTWNGSNTLAGGIDSTQGLTPLGKRVILRLNEKKMICDFSHLNDKSFFAAYALADRPIVSHTCCRKLNPNPRNITDEQLNLIRQKNGLIGLCFYPVFLGGDNVFDLFRQQVEHCLSLGLQNNIAIGSDFDGAKMSPKLCNVGQVHNLYRYLRLKGIDKQILNKLFYENAYRFFSSL